jgi:hypothetical protein
MKKDYIRYEDVLLGKTTLPPGMELNFVGPHTKPFL